MPGFRPTSSVSDSRRAIRRPRPARGYCDVAGESARASDPCPARRLRVQRLARSIVRRRRPARREVSAARSRAPSARSASRRPAPARCRCVLGGDLRARLAAPRRPAESAASPVISACSIVSPSAPYFRSTSRPDQRLQPARRRLRWSVICDVAAQFQRFDALLVVASDAPRPRRPRSSAPLAPASHRRARSCTYLSRPRGSRSPPDATSIAPLPLSSAVDVHDGLIENREDVLVVVVDVMPMPDPVMRPRENSTAPGARTMPSRLGVGGVLRSSTVKPSLDRRRARSRERRPSPRRRRTLPSLPVIVNVVCRLARR